MRRENHFIAGTEVLAPPEVLDRHADASAFGMPVRQAGADLLADAEQLQLFAKLAVVAPLGLFDPRQGRVKRLLRNIGHAVQALQHRVVLVTAIVRTGHRHQLDRADLGCRRHVGTAAEIGEPAAGVQRDRLAGRNVSQALQLVGLARQQRGGLVARDLASLERQTGLDQRLDRRIDRRKILGRETVSHVEIIVESVFR